MPDRYGTYDDMTVLEFLDFFARAYRLKGAERKKRVDSVMEFAGLVPLARQAHRRAVEGHVKQRVALGRTLLLRPELIDSRRCGCDQHRLPCAASALKQRSAHSMRARGFEAVGRIVENQQPRVVQQRAPQRHRAASCPSTARR